MVLGILASIEKIGFSSHTSPLFLKDEDDYNLVYMSLTHGRLFYVLKVF